MPCLRPHTIALALLLAPCLTSAQMPGMPGGTRPVSLVVSGGLTLPAGDLANFHDSGFHYDVSLLLNIPGFPIGLRPEFSLTQLKLKEAPQAPDASDMTKMMAFMGNIELPLAAGLYLLAGGGLLSLDTDGESASKIAFDAGAGFRFALGGIRGFVEARMGAASYDQGKFGFEKAQFIPVTFGLVF